MPERAEIAIMSDCLASKLNGKLCKQIVIMSKYTSGYENGLYSSSKLNYIQGDGYKLLEVDTNLTRVTSRGKKIIFHFDKEKYEPFRFVSGCGLNGHWSLTQSDYTAIILVFEGIMAFYEESGIGGNFSVCLYPSPEYEHIFKDVGPDLMTDEVTPQIYYDIIKRKRISHMKICDFMMEQKYMSGIGNYLRAEILYKCRISPHRQLSSLTDTDIYNLYQFSKLTIFKTYRSNGLTIQSYVDPNGLIGTYSCFCYGRKTDSEGNEIITEKDNQKRKIHWCPNVQK